MAQVKISELPTLAQQLQSANYIPLIHNGITYKYAPFNYVVKNSGDETITGVKTFSSSPIVPAGDATGEAVNYDQLTLVDQKHSVIDNTSRVAEYTGDGIPLIPDNVAGTVFVRDGNWTDLGGWAVTGATASYINGKLRLTVTGNIPQIFHSSYSSYSGKELRYRIRKISGSSTIFIVYSGGVIKASTITTGTTVFDTVILPTLSGNLSLVFDGATLGDVYEIETVYIGTGAYDTPALDRAGNGNNLTLNAITPVNGKFGKEMSFNGTTSYAQASSPVIGTTGTVAVRFKINTIGLNHIIFDNRDAAGNNGYQFYVDAANRLVFIMRGASGQAQDLTLSQTLDTGYHTLSIHCTGSSVLFYLDGHLINTTMITITVAASSTNLKIGNRSSAFLNGIISHFRYDSRIWTVDEARAWSLNPSVEDSLSMSETPSAGDVMVWPNNGLLYKDFIITSPAAGGVASLSHGLTTTKVRSIDATLVNASGAVVPRGYLNADGTRNAKFDINLNSTSVYVVSDSTLAATWVGQPVYIRIGYTV